MEAFLDVCFALISYFAYSSARKMEVTRSFETSVDFQLTSRHYIQKDRILHVLI